MKKLLILGPKSFLCKKFLQKIDTKKFEIYLLCKNKQDVEKVSELYKRNKFKKIELVKILNKKINLNKLKIDYLVNFITLYDNNKNSYLDIYKYNVEIPTLFFNIADKSNIKFFINIDTILDKKTNFYALTKYIFRESILSFFSKNKIKVINLQFHNFYSYKKNESNLISKIITLSLKNEKITLTKGNQIRDFIHIDDASELILNILKNINKFNRKRNYNFNIGGNQPISVKKITDIIRRYYGGKIKLNIREKKYVNSYEMINYYSDLKDINKITKWYPQDKLLEYFK